MSSSRLTLACLPSKNDNQCYANDFPDILIIFSLLLWLTTAFDRIKKLGRTKLKIQNTILSQFYNKDLGRRCNAKTKQNIISLWSLWWLLHICKNSGVGREATDKIKKKLTSVNSEKKFHTLLPIQSS